MKGTGKPEFFTDKERIAQLLLLKPAGDITNSIADMQIQKAEDILKENSELLEKIARNRADELLREHKEVRDSVRLGGTWKVEPCLPVDVMGVSVLIPVL